MMTSSNGNIFRITGPLCIKLREAIARLTETYEVQLFTLALNLDKLSLEQRQVEFN